MLTTIASLFALVTMLMNGFYLVDHYLRYGVPSNH